MIGKIPIYKRLAYGLGFFGSCFTALDAEGTGNGGEDGDEEVDYGFPIFFFHDVPFFDV